MIRDAVSCVLSRGELGCALRYKLLVLVLVEGENSCRLRYCLFVVECRSRSDKRWRWMMSREVQAMVYSCS